MREIIAQQLWLGTALDSRDPQGLFAAGVCAVVDLAYEESPAQLPRSLIYCRFPLVDGDGNDERLLLSAVGTLHQLLAQRLPTLVSCSAGMSRSPAIAAAALARIRNESLDKALHSVVASHPHDVSPSLWADLNRLHHSHG